MEGLKWGRIMIACGESKGGAARRRSASPRNAFAKLAQKLLPVPLAYGAADVDLVTGTETPPNIIQSETYTTANPDNPDEILCRVQRLPMREPAATSPPYRPPPTAA